MIQEVRAEQKPWKQSTTTRWRALVLVTPRFLQVQGAKGKSRNTLRKVMETPSKERPIPGRRTREWKRPAALGQMINVIYFDQIMKNEQL